jgi:hypothetical protein
MSRRLKGHYHLISTGRVPRVAYLRGDKDKTVWAVSLRVLGTPGLLRAYRTNG